MRHICANLGKKDCYTLELREGYSTWIVYVNQPRNKEHHNKPIIAVDYCPWCGEKLEK